MKKKQLKFHRKTGKGGSACDSGDESNYEIGGHSDGEDGGFPAECPICEGDFSDPVVTKCKHYFCDGCAIRNYASDFNCFVCGTATDGIFNAARDLIKHLKERPIVAEPNYEVGASEDDLPEVDSPEDCLHNNAD